MPSTYERMMTVRNRWRKAINAAPEHAILGAANGELRVPGLPNYVYTQKYTSNGLSQPLPTFLPSNISIPLVIGTPVLIGMTTEGREGIISVDTLAQSGSGSDSVSAISAQQQNPTGSNTQSALPTLKVIASATPDLFVYVQAWNVYVNGTFYSVIGYAVDLSGVIPAAGEMCYAVLAVLADLSDVEVAVSTARPMTDDPLDDDDVNEASALLSFGSTPVVALYIADAQTTIAQSQIDNTPSKDLRQMINVSQTGIACLASVDGVDMNTGTPTALFTALGRSCVISHVAVRNASTSLTTASYSFGANSASYNDIIANATHTELTGATLYTILTAKAGARLLAPGDVFSVKMNTLQGGAATTTMDVFGYPL